MNKETVLGALLRDIGKSKIENTNTQYNITMRFLNNLPKQTLSKNQHLENFTKPKILGDSIDNIFATAASRLPIEEDSLFQEPDELNVHFAARLVDAYKVRAELYDKHLSIYDSLFESTSPYKDALFNKYKNNIQLILVNLYRITFVFDLLYTINQQTTIEEAVFTVFTLTSNFDDNKSPVDMTLSLSQFLDELMKPPDWVFCKRLMDNLKLAFVVSKNDNEEVKLYNKKYYTDRLYILVEFETSYNVYLKSVVRYTN